MPAPEPRRSARRWAAAAPASADEIVKPPISACRMLGWKSTRALQLSPLASDVSPSTQSPASGRSSARSCRSSPGSAPPRVVPPDCSARRRASPSARNSSSTSQPAPASRVEPAPHVLFRIENSVTSAGSSRAPASVSGSSPWFSKRTLPKPELLSTTPAKSTVDTEGSSTPGARVGYRIFGRGRKPRGAVCKANSEACGVLCSGGKSRVKSGRATPTRVTGRQPNQRKR